MSLDFTRHRGNKQEEIKILVHNQIMIEVVLQRVVYIVHAIQADIKRIHSQIN